MPYRNPTDDVGERLSLLRDELLALRRQIASSRTIKHRARQLQQEIDRLAKLEAQRVPLLRRISIASPCHESWNDMDGDERERHCGQCDKAVFNLSAMKSVEAEDLLARHGTSICARFYRRADGTVMTSDCQVGRAHQRKQRLLTAVAAAGAAAIATGIVTGAMQGKAQEGSKGCAPPVVSPATPKVEPPQPVLGKIAIAPPQGDAKEDWLQGDVALGPEN